MRKIWDKIVSFLTKIPQDKWMHFCAGLIISAFFAIVFPKAIECVMVPAIAFGILKEFFDLWTTQKWEWLDFLATSLGGLLIWIFVLFYNLIAV